METPVPEEESVQQINYNKLFDGIRGFKANEHIPRQEFYAELSKHQNPHTLFIGCLIRVLFQILSPEQSLVNCLWCAT